MAAFAAQAAQGHIGRARRLATDEEARRERRDVLSLPRSLQGVGSALSAAKDLVDAAQAEAAALTKDRDAAEKESLSHGARRRRDRQGRHRRRRAAAPARSRSWRSGRRAAAPAPSATPSTARWSTSPPSTATCCSCSSAPAPRWCTPTSASRPPRSPAATHAGVDAAPDRRRAGLPRGARRQRRAAARRRGDGARPADGVSGEPARLADSSAHHAALAQSAEHLTRNEVVRGSIPRGGSTTGRADPVCASCCVVRPHPPGHPPVTGRPSARGTFRRDPVLPAPLARGRPRDPAIPAPPHRPGRPGRLRPRPHRLR